MGSLSLLSPFLALLLLHTPAQAAQSISLLHSICNQTSNYTFCQNTLYSDPRARAPGADRVVLAYVSFGLAYLNASATSKQIPHLLKEKGCQKEGLQRCSDEYATAVAATAEAYEDLDSETYSGLKELVGIASDSAAKCECGLNRTSGGSPLTERNRGLMGLCEICEVVANLFI